MSDLVAPGWLAAAHLAVSAVAVLWNIAIAGRITRWRDAPPSISLLTALAGLLIAPAALVAVVSDSSLVGRALHNIAWVWPAVTLIVAAQALVATVRGYVPLLSGAPILAYDLVVAAVALARYAIFLGHAPPEPLVALVAAEATALEIGAHPEAALLPLYLHVPLLAPAVTARRWRLAIAVRMALATLAATWTALITICYPQAREAVRGYARFASERPQERPQGDFAVGLRIFPRLDGDGPPALALANDMALARELDAAVLSLAIEPRHVTAPLLDSLARVLDERRQGGTRLVVALAVRDDAPPSGAHSAAWMRARATEVETIVRRLRPDYIVPALPRPGARRRVPLAQWTTYLSAAAATSRRVRPRTRVMLLVGSYGARDSTLHAWASRDGSGFDAIGYRVIPSARGAASLDARLATAERWMRAHPSRAEQWVLEAGGLPLAHGERSQALALWRTISWATRQPQVRGVIVHEASDYEGPIGLRATSGRLRAAAGTVDRAARMMGETGAGQ